MGIEVEFKSGVPLSEQIAQQMEERITAGKAVPGEQLPTTRQLAVNLGINFNTVARAYRILARKGLISTQQGRGTYVLGVDHKMTAKKVTKSGIENLTRYYINKAAYLGFEPEEIRDCFEKIVQEELEE